MFLNNFLISLLIILLHMSVLRQFFPKVWDLYISLILILKGEFWTYTILVVSAIVRAGAWAVLLTFVTPWFYMVFGVLEIKSLISNYKENKG